jgi:hypothetical protein
MQGRAPLRTGRTICSRVAGLALVLAPVGPGAAAQKALSSESPARPESRLGLDVGLLSAIGSAGVTLAYSPHPNLLVEGGAGIGLSGLQLSLMPKLQLGRRGDHFVAGAGVAASGRS